MEKFNKLTYFINENGFVNTITIHGVSDDTLLMWIKEGNAVVNDAFGYVWSDEDTSLIYGYCLNQIEAPEGFDFNAMFELFEELNK